MIKISEINISFVKPVDGLVAFASVVANDDIYLGSIAIHQRLDGKGFRITYPTKKSNLTQRPIFHPINKATSAAIEEAVFKKLKNVMSKGHAGYYCADID